VIVERKNRVDHALSRNRSDERAQGEYSKRETHYSRERLAVGDRQGKVAGSGRRTRLAHSEEKRGGVT